MCIRDRVTRAGYYAVQLSRASAQSAHQPDSQATQRVKLTYTTRLTRESSGALSGVIPLPPVAAADVTAIGIGRARVIPALTLNAQLIARAVPLKGALAVMIPEIESGLLLQREDLSVTLHESGEGADVELTITALSRGEVKQGCCLLYTSPSPRDATLSRMPSSA